MLYLVRHGETDWNLFKRFNGRTDTYLNQTGLEQAKLQAVNLRDVSFDVCFCSPQTRARQFCEMIHQGEIIFDERLAEIDCGEFEGTEETTEALSLFWRAIRNGDSGTERFTDFINRNCALCDVIMTEHQGRNVLIVTHAANARVINYCFQGKPQNYDFSQRVMEKGELLILDSSKAGE